MTHSSRMGAVRPLRQDPRGARFGSDTLVVGVGDTGYAGRRWQQRCAEQLEILCFCIYTLGLQSYLLRRWDWGGFGGFKYLLRRYLEV